MSAPLTAYEYGRSTAEAIETPVVLVRDASSRPTAITPDSMAVHGSRQGVSALPSRFPPGLFRLLRDMHSHTEGTDTMALERFRLAAGLDAEAELVLFDPHALTECGICRITLMTEARLQCSACAC